MLQRRIYTVFLSTFFLFCALTQARVISNADFVGGSPTLVLPSGWQLFSSSLPVSALFDGVSDNPGNGRFVPEQGSGASLSNTNFISITVDFIAPMEINSFEIANDFGGGTIHEAVAMEVILRGNGGDLFTFTGNIEDNVIDDIDPVFTGLSVNSVTSIEFRIIEQDINPAIEIREFILRGTEASTSIPEPTTLLLSGLAMLSILFRKKGKKIC